jgi:hypothetical protein
MEKEFIPYEQALALKELGFDEPCFGAFNKNGVLQRATSDWWNKDTLIRINSATYADLETLTPLYQQAFRWFRDEYDLDSFVKHLYKSTVKVGYYFGINKYKGVEFQTDFDVWYNSYEEAELECLKKLIEIVKNK